MRTIDPTADLSFAIGASKGQGRVEVKGDAQGHALPNGGGRVAHAHEDLLLSRAAGGACL